MNITNPICIHLLQGAGFGIRVRTNAQNIIPLIDNNSTNILLLIVKLFGYIYRFIEHLIFPFWNYFKSIDISAIIVTLSM
jgi:hypothetical protein